MANVNHAGYHQAANLLKRFIEGGNGKPIQSMNMDNMISVGAEQMYGELPFIVEDVHNLYIAGASQDVTIEAVVRHVDSAKLQYFSTSTGWFNSSTNVLIDGDNVSATRKFTVSEANYNWRFAFTNDYGTTYSQVFRVERPATMSLNEVNEETEETNNG